MDLTSLYSVPLWNSEYPEFEEHKEIFLLRLKNLEIKTQMGMKIENQHRWLSISNTSSCKEFRPLFEHICQMSCFSATWILSNVMSQ